MEASPAFNPNDPEKLTAQDNDCKCGNCYTVEKAEFGKFLILHHGIMVAGPMDKHAAEDWMDKQGSEG